MGKSTGQRGTKRGTVLAGRYEIGELLGEGGFGAAYRATDLSRFGAVCVVKLLHSSQTTSDTASPNRRFTATSLRHRSQAPGLPHHTEADAEAA